MADSKNKTRANKKSVTEYINSITPRERKKEIETVLKYMKDVTKETPVMWGSSIVGFGSYHYKYESGKLIIHQILLNQ